MLLILEYPPAGERQIECQQPQETGRQPSSQRRWQEAHWDSSPSLRRQHSAYPTHIEQPQCVTKVCVCVCVCVCTAVCVCYVRECVFVARLPPALPCVHGLTRLGEFERCSVATAILSPQIRPALRRACLASSRRRPRLERRGV